MHSVPTSGRAKPDGMGWARVCSMNTQHLPSPLTTAIERSEVLSSSGMGSVCLFHLLGLDLRPTAPKPLHGLSSGFVEQPRERSVLGCVIPRIVYDSSELGNVFQVREQATRSQSAG